MRRWISVTALSVPVLVLAWWLGSPLFVDRVADEEFPYARTAVVPDTMTRPQVERLMAAAADMAESVDESMPNITTPERLKTGRFRDADSFHRGSGTATVYRLPNGMHLLRLEQFEVTNGPDLRVLLTTHADPQSRADLDSSGYVELASLKGNIGNQNYPIPQNIDLGRQASVVIYCRPFHVVFSVAPLTDPES